MALFAKNKPTQRVELGGDDWVELQALSKGVKDDIKNMVTNATRGMKISRDLASQDEMNLPEDFVRKTKAAEYEKMRHAIVRWSSDEPITVETIKNLDEEIFDAISEAIDAMNALTEEEEKN